MTAGASSKAALVKTMPVLCLTLAFCLPGVNAPQGFSEHIFGSINPGVRRTADETIVDSDSGVGAHGSMW